MKVFNTPEADLLAFQSWARNRTVPSSYLQEVLGAGSFSTAQPANVAALLEASEERNESFLATFIREAPQDEARELAALAGADRAESGRKTYNNCK